MNTEHYPETLYVMSDGTPVEIFEGRYEARANIENLPIGRSVRRIGEYKLVRQIEARLEVVIRNEVG